MTSTQSDEFVETTDLPRGRKARVVSDKIWEKLREAATRGVAFTRTDTPELIDKLRKDLQSAAVRAKYLVTVETNKDNATRHVLKFSATRKPAEPAANTETAK